MATLSLEKPAPSYVADAQGRFGGEFGGRFVPETIIPALDELTEEYEKARADPAFQTELDYYAKNYVGRPTPLFFAEKMTQELGGAKIYLKREDLAHTGRTQDQQRPRPDPARAAHAQAAHHRRDRRGPARRRHGHGLRPVRLPVRRLHG